MAGRSKTGVTAPQSAASGVITEVVVQDEQAPTETVQGDSGTKADPTPKAKAKTASVEVTNTTTRVLFEPHTATSLPAGETVVIECKNDYQATVVRQNIDQINQLAGSRILSMKG